MEKITWQHVVIVVAALASIIALVKLGENLTAVGVFIAGLLAWIGTQQASTKEQITQVSTNTNGNNKTLVEAILESQREDRQLIKQILLALPPGTSVAGLTSQPPAPAPEVVDEEPV